MFDSQEVISENAYWIVRRRLSDIVNSILLDNFLFGQLNVPIRSEIKTRLLRHLFDENFRIEDNIKDSILKSLAQ